MKLILALVVLLSAAVSTAPVRRKVRSSLVAGTADQNELDKILKEGLLDDDGNVEKLRDLVEVVSDGERVCGLLTFTIFCIDEGEGADPINCTSGYNVSFAWTSVDQTVLAGKIVFMFAAFNWRVFAFEMGEVCNLNIENSIIFNVTVPSLGNSCSTEECIKTSLEALTEQVPMLVNSSTEARIHSAAEIDSVVFPLLLVSGAIALSLVSIISIYSHAKVVTKSKQHQKEPKKPKLYFQFWALHCSAFIFLIYTMYLNLENINDSHRGIRFSTTIAVLFASAFFPFFSVCFDVETPTSCCRCCCYNRRSSYGFMLAFHYIVLFFAVWILTVATGFLLLAIPTIVLHYYISPIKTLIHLQLLASAAIYTNSLLALLIFQCERCLYPFVGYCKPEIIATKWKCFRYSFWTGIFSFCATQIPQQEDDQFCKNYCQYLCVRYSQPPESSPFIARVANHDSYYASFFEVENKDTSGLRLTTYICHPFSTVVVLSILLFFVVLLSEFISLGDINSVSDLESLIILVPTSLLLFGSWYKLDIFLDIEPEKSEKEILGELLQEMKISNRTAPWITIKDIQLYISDRDSITDENGWLTDNVINAAQKVLKEQYQNYGGFQSSSLDKQSQYTIVRERKFVQILFVNGNHWITVSNVGTSDDEDSHVWVYDNCTRADNEVLHDDELKTQIGLIYPKRDLQVYGSRLTNLPANPYDSGLFAIAFATTLCSEEDRSVENKDYAEEKFLRSHLKNCLELKNITPFPLRWVKVEGIQLYPDDRNSITAENGVLTDDVINAAQKLLKKKFSHIGGFQSCSRDKQVQYTTVKTHKFVQILFVNGNHWIAVSNTETTNDNEVWAYDSCGANNYYNIRTEIRLIYPENDFKIYSWRLPNLPLAGPTDHYSSALFAVAFATSLCFRNGLVQDQTYAKEELLRQHLLRCLEQNEMTQFPLRWVKIEDIQLYSFDLHSIENCLTQSLTYPVIDAAQNLLGRQHPNIGGFESCAPDKPHTPVAKPTFVQILFHENHFITVSNLKADHANRVWVYDSCTDGRNKVLAENAAIVKDIRAIYQQNDLQVYGSRLVNNMPADPPNHISSALFAIAFATSLCFDGNDSDVVDRKYAQVEVLQKHLIKCLKAEEMTRFPLRWVLIDDLELNTIDQSSITDDGGWLTDNVVNASQKLIKTQYADNSNISGFQPCTLSSRYTAMAADAKFVQISLVKGARKRWITISNVLCPQENVDVYDPLYPEAERKELQDADGENIKRQIDALCQGRTPYNVPIKYRPPQPGQPPQDDPPLPAPQGQLLSGGAFLAIAIAMTLCSPNNDNNPTEKNYHTIENGATRNILENCIFTEDMSAFKTATDELDLIDL